MCGTVECVKVFDGGKVEVIFEGGYVVEEQVLNKHTDLRNIRNHRPTA